VEGSIFNLLYNFNIIRGILVRLTLNIAAPRKGVQMHLINIIIYKNINFIEMGGKIKAYKSLLELAFI
jgi:hypothetical protein